MYFKCIGDDKKAAFSLVLIAVSQSAGMRESEGVQSSAQGTAINSDTIYVTIAIVRIDYYHQHAE